jgi:Asp-tRNA(Asn)/Glu-tRNA(Gln) amidotransferase A subunit family amidase
MSLDRRQVFHAIAALGVGTIAFQRALASEVVQDDAKPEPSDGPKTITAEMVQNAEWIAGLTLTEAERKQLAAGLTRSLPSLRRARTTELPNAVAPALHFLPQPGLKPSQDRGTVTPPAIDGKPPESEDDLAFASVAQLGAWLKAKLITSVDLTKLAIKRLKQYDPSLLCVVTLTEDLAMKQAEAADKELSAGKVRGPLHGIPWGAKDLVSCPGYPTTWGAEHYSKQSFDVTATVAHKLDEAGAVLVAKLTLGALALGDQWFGGMTRNPWNQEQGSSGSSAGSCSAVSAGLVPFAIGSETLGSIVSPSTRCGVTGLRPTFGRVSRAGCMALCWSMDKLGPITRSVEDAALVFDAIHGMDAGDPSTTDQPFHWPSAKPLDQLKVGYTQSRQAPEDRDELNVLKELGVQLVKIELPNSLPLQAILTILEVESASAFDELPRGGIREGYGNFWKSTFISGQFVTAVEYLRANRLRTLLMQQMATVFEKVDLYVGGNDLQITNLTGHPTVCLPNGFNKNRDGIETPKALTFTGKLYGETELMSVAHAYQLATKHHLKRPPLDKLKPLNKQG